MNKKSKSLKLVIGILAALLAVMVGVVILMETREPDAPEAGGAATHPTEPAATQTGEVPETTAQTEPVVPAVTVPETEPVVYEGIPVETPCGTIYLPDDWDEPITAETVSENPVVMDFLAGDMRLYSLRFSASPDGAIGWVRTEDGVVYVGMEIGELDDFNDQLLSMQESVNVLLEQLALNSMASAPGETEPVIGDLVIETVYGDLLFPGKWEDYLQLGKPDDRTVAFYGSLTDHEPVLLFKVVFERDDGDIVLEMLSTDHSVVPVSLYIAQIEFDGRWKEEEMNLVYAMQEDMNYLLDGLQK